MDETWTVAVAVSSHGDGVMIYWTCHTEEAALACYAEQDGHGMATILFRGAPLRFTQYTVEKREPPQVVGTTPAPQV